MKWKTHYRTDKSDAMVKRPLARLTLGGIAGTCMADAKCVRKAGHEGDCWPQTAPDQSKHDA